MLKLFDHVIIVLETKPATRDDDFLLYFYVARSVLLASDYLIKNHITLDSITFEKAMLNHKAYGLPSFSSVIKYRRELQTKNPHLLGESAQKRAEYERDYHKKYSKRG